MSPVLLWHPGTSISTADVASGFAAGLKANGVNVIGYRMDRQLELAGAYLRLMWRKDRTRPKPTEADIIYYASLWILGHAVRAAVERGVEWVVIITGAYQHPDLLVLLRRAGLKVAVVLTESPYESEPEMRYIEQAHVATTNERTMVEPYRQVCRHTYYLPMAWHPELPSYYASAPVREGLCGHEVIFVATGFIERVRWLDAMPWQGIDLGLYGTWSLLPPRHRLRAYVRGRESVQADTAVRYRLSGMTINVHRTSRTFSRHTEHVQGESANIRLYETAACGVFTLSDWRPEVTEIFGDSVPTARTPAEMAAWIARARRDPGWVAACREAARERVQQHSWTARVAQWLQMVEDYERRHAA